LQSIPSGILHRGRRCVVGCGVVVNPRALIEEMEALVRRGVVLDGNLFISKNAHLIMPYHPALDRASEAKLGSRRIGTTGRGVGPAYVDKAARVGIRVGDLLNERLFREKLEMNVAQKNRLLREIYDAPTFSVAEILDQYLRYAGWLAPYVTVTGRPRRCGWFDAMVLRYAVRVNGLDTVALTKLDVLDQCAAIKICTAYRYQGGILTDFPEDETVVAEAEPVYEEIEGWLATTSGARSEV